MTSEANSIAIVSPVIVSPLRSVRSRRPRLVLLIAVVLAAAAGLAAGNGTAASHVAQTTVRI